MGRDEETGAQHHRERYRYVCSSGILRARPKVILVPKPSSAIPPRLGTNGNPTTYASGNSSLTPSQSTSQSAPMSVETSHEGPTPMQHDHVQPETTSQARQDRDLTIPLPHAHAISEMTVPSVRRSLENGDPTPSTAPVPTRKRSMHPRRPPSQHIAEVSRGPSNRSARAHAPFSATTATHDTRSDDRSK
ncbi:hypothetical protein OG21DRAFT_1012978 [Imleria badia]|nr:hypothetical protein OG21DRAFT_1012978 [Imleria badia]